MNTYIFKITVCTKSIDIIEQEVCIFKQPAPPPQAIRAFKRGISKIKYYQRLPSCWLQLFCATTNPKNLVQQPNSYVCTDSLKPTSNLPDVSFNPFSHSGWSPLMHFESPNTLVYQSVLFLIKQESKQNKTEKTFQSKPPDKKD